MMTETTAVPAKPTLPARLSDKADYDLIERWPRPILWWTRRPTDVNKAGNALMRRQAESIEHTAIVGVPFGDPICPVTERVRSEDKAHGGGTRGEHLFPFRDFHMRPGAAHHGDHEWGALETFALGLDMFGLRIRVLSAKRCGDCDASRTPRLAFKHDEAPGCQLAMIGHPRGDGQESVDFGRGRCGPGEFYRFERAPGSEEFKGIGHSAGDHPRCSKKHVRT